MNEHDIKLANAAWRVPYTKWYTIDPGEAETEAGRRYLDMVKGHKYRDEEYYAGLA